MIEQRKSFTLIELVVIIMIIGILVSISLPNFVRTFERARNHEASVNLRLIKAALEIYHSNTGLWYPNDGSPGMFYQSDINEINNTLNIDVPPETIWDYEMRAWDAGFAVWADRTTYRRPPGYNRTIYILWSETETTCNNIAPDTLGCN